MAWDRAKIGSGEVWRLITGHLVHSNSNHILLNSIGISVVLPLIGDKFPTRTLCSLSVFIAFLTSLLLYVFEPQLSYYVGFSAVLHGLVASYSITALRKTPRYACLILCLLGLKLAFEGQPQFTANLIGIRVATESHWWGFVSGIIVGGIYTGMLLKRKTTTAMEQD
jgi:rhomboid family GlyGly-CTERM serine protease